MPIPVNINDPIDLNGFPDTNLRQKDFNQLVYKRGYNVYIDRMMKCPCEENQSNSARLTCTNCFGTGWILVERVETKAMIASINNPTVYREYSPENYGTVQITTLSDNSPLEFMSRITLYEDLTFYSELLNPRYLESGEVIAFSAYKPEEILQLYCYQGDEKPLLKIDVKKVEIDKEGKLILTEALREVQKREDYVFTDNPTLSIRYKYHPSYTVIDVPRSMHISVTDAPLHPTVDKKSRQWFPCSAIARATHLILNRNINELPEGMQSNIENQQTTKFDEIEDKMIVSKEFCETEKKEG